MAANKKPTRRGPRDANEILSMQIRASERHRELLHESRELLNAGKVSEARKRLRQAERLHAQMQASDEQRRRAPKPGR